jgi:hypothetical protein
MGGRCLRNAILANKFDKIKAFKSGWKRYIIIEANFGKGLASMLRKEPIARP